MCICLALTRPSHCTPPTCLTHRLHGLRILTLPQVTVSTVCVFVILSLCTTRSRTWPAGRCKCYSWSHATSSALSMIVCLFATPMSLFHGLRYCQFTLGPFVTLIPFGQGSPLPGLSVDVRCLPFNNVKNEELTVRELGLCPISLNTMSHEGGWAFFPRSGRSCTLRNRLFNLPRLS